MKYVLPFLIFLCFSASAETKNNFVHGYYFKIPPGFNLIESTEEEPSGNGDKYKRLGRKLLAKLTNSTSGENVRGLTFIVSVKEEPIISDIELLKKASGSSVRGVDFSYDWNNFRRLDNQKSKSSYFSRTIENRQILIEAYYSPNTLSSDLESAMLDIKLRRNMKNDT
jgi:hypothetical protein